MKHKEIIILHEINGKPYFEGVEYFANINDYKVTYYETSIIKLLLKDIFKKNFSMNTIKRSIKNFIFRIRVPFIKNKIIIMGIPPFDYRIAWYSILLKNNNFIYHTSHPNWGELETVPRTYSIFTPLFQLLWINFLSKEKLKIVTVTKSSYLTLKNNFTIKGLLYQIYHSVNNFNFSKSKEMNSSILNIVFVGKLLYEKGLDTVVELIKTLDKNKYHFHIVGDGEYRSSIEHIFKNKNVTYYGWIDNKQDISQIYRKGDIFLNPSIKIKGWEELFGLVNIEAMSSGLVVIASKHIGPSEIITDTVDGFLVEEKNSKKISMIIEELYHNRTFLQMLKLNAIETSNKFTIESISKQWEEVINE